jgi:hypothetical protein
MTELYKLRLELGPFFSGGFGYGAAYPIEDFFDFWNVGSSGIDSLMQLSEVDHDASYTTIAVLLHHRFRPMLSTSATVGVVGDCLGLRHYMSARAICKLQHRSATRVRGEFHNQIQVHVDGSFDFVRSISDHFCHHFLRSHKRAI